MTQIKELLKSRIGNRIGQSLTSTVIGVAILGMVGAATAGMISAQRATESNLAITAEVSSIMQGYADEIRAMTPYYELEDRYGGKNFEVRGGGTLSTSMR